MEASFKIDEGQLVLIVNKLDKNLGVISKPLIDNFINRSLRDGIECKKDENDNLEIKPFIKDINK